MESPLLPALQADDDAIEKDAIHLLSEVEVIIYIINKILDIEDLDKEDYSHIQTVINVLSDALKSFM